MPRKTPNPAPWGLARLTLRPGLVAPGLRADFEALAAFCAHADRLADDHAHTPEARSEAAAALAEARVELHAAADNFRSRPPFADLGAAIRRCGAPLGLFDDLLTALEHDQRHLQIETSERLLEHAGRRAVPLGRVALRLAPETTDPEAGERMDALMLGAQLAGFWQDLRADLLERGRVRMPTGVTNLTIEQLRGLCDRAGPDAEVRFSAALRPLVRRTRELLGLAADVHRGVDPRIAPAVWTLGAEAARVLDRIEASGCTALWSRPELTRADRFALNRGVKRAGRGR